MKKNYEITEARESGDGEKVLFTLQFNSQSKRCQISRTALIILGKAQEGSILEIFETNRNKIADAAMRHAATYSQNEFILLGSNDF